MTSPGRVADRRTAIAAAVPAVLLVAGLSAAVTLRAALTDAGLDGVAVGWVFGACLGALALAAGWRPAPVATRPVLTGLAGGLAIVGLALLGRLRGPGLALDTGVPFRPGAAVTLLVAAAEEWVLRGVLFDALAASIGVAGALGLSSVAFALMHVPAYGWTVVPLDLGVGLVLGGLRLASGGPGAPALAHALADLAAWFL